VAEIRIADDRGDHGPPNPFRHYPRGSGYVRMSWVFDTLVWKDEGGQFVPALARSWSYDGAKRAYAFQLDPRARWHDDRPLTAEDVAFTLAYLREHPYPWVSLDAVDRAEVAGPHAVTVYLARPYAPFLAEIGGTLPILPRHIWAPVENPQAFDGPSAFVGSGPYRFRHFDPTQGTYLYEAFADYYQGRPRADRLIYFRSTNPLVSLSSGQADLAQIQADLAEPLRRQGLTVLEDERSWVRKLMINHTRAPFDQRDFRRALAHALDREELIAKGQRGFASPAGCGLLSPDHPLYNPAAPAYPHDPARARALLAGLGYRPDDQGFFHKDGRSLQVELLASSITVSGGAGSDRDGAILKKQLEAVGIRVRALALEPTTADQRVRSFDFELAISGHGGISGDPRGLNELILPAAGSVNSSHYDRSPELNQLLAAQLAEMDPAKRVALVHRIQELVAEELPAIPLYYPAAMTAFRPAKGIRWFYTPGGLARGVPIAQNKLALLP
jgi:peptide/nickel transport system substrate-binding protein